MSEVVFIMLLNSLPSGGMMTLAAWGRTMRCIASPICHSQRFGRFHLAGVNGLDPGADDFRHVGAFVNAKCQRACLYGTSDA